jgi:hypothetical protein
MPKRFHAYFGLPLACLISSVPFSTAQADGILDHLFTSSSARSIAGLELGMSVDEITAQIRKIAPKSDQPQFEPTAAVNSKTGQSIGYGTKLSVTDNSTVDIPVFVDALFSTSEFGAQAYALKWMVMPTYGGTKSTLKIVMSRASYTFGQPTYFTKSGESVTALYFYADGKLVTPQSTADQMTECTLSATVLDCPYLKMQQDQPGRDGKAKVWAKQPCGTYLARVTLLAAPIQVEWENLEIAEDPLCDGVLSLSFNIKDGTVQTIEASLMDMKVAQRIEDVVRQQLAK